jgi:hypothetical protein
MDEAARPVKLLVIDASFAADDARRRFLVRGGIGVSSSGVIPIRQSAAERECVALMVGGCLRFL